MIEKKQAEKIISLVTEYLFAVGSVENADELYDGLVETIQKTLSTGEKTDIVALAAAVDKLEVSDVKVK